MSTYQNKYLKYKAKYLELKKTLNFSSLTGGSDPTSQMRPNPSYSTYFQTLKYKPRSEIELELNKIYDDAKFGLVTRGIDLNTDANKISGDLLGPAIYDLDKHKSVPIQPNGEEPVGEYLERLHKIRLEQFKSLKNTPIKVLELELEHMYHDTKKILTNRGIDLSTDANKVSGDLLGPAQYDFKNHKSRVIQPNGEETVGEYLERLHQLRVDQFKEIFN